MSLSAEVDIEVPFYDVDPMLVVWHGHYVKYFEQARCALLRRIDYDYPAMQASGYLWPVVELHMKYVHSARYGQRLRARATLLEYENRLKIGYLIIDRETGERVTKGHSVQVAVHAATRELQFVSPQVLLDKVSAR
jgi:acyl-CoA thioester hydrolase